jgi:hypothetical protein
MGQGVARSRQLTRLLMLTVLLLLGRSAAANDACSGPYANPITVENCRSDPASWTSAWKADRENLTYDTRVLAGYVSRQSVNAGETIHFYVRAPAEFNIDFYRLGWYGGSGGRLVKVARDLARPDQPACEWQDGGTVDGYVTCRNWRRSYSLAVPEGWTSGIYLAAIRSIALPADTRRSARTYAHDVLFVVRDDQRRADFIYQQAVATEQAYNGYSYGPGLYNSQVIAGQTVPVAKASFERPFDAIDNLQFYRFELPFVMWLERNGYDVVYSTDIDTHERQQPFKSQYKAFLTSGHSEYWTKQMYDAVQQARDDTVHLGFFSGNTLYWQMRLEEDRAPPGDGTHASLDRVMVVYRHPGPRNALGLGDPNPDPALQTTNWRAFPVMRDEETLVGVHFAHPGRCQEHVAGWAGFGMPPEPGRAQTAPELRADPQTLTVADGSSWVYQGTGLQSGDSVPHVYGQEADSFERAIPMQPCGRGPQEPPARPPAYRAGTFSVLSSSAFSAAEVTATGVRLIPTHLPVNSVMYQACSGAWVFAAGDIMWADALGPALILGKDYSSTQIEQMTHNVLDVFSGRTTSPAGASGRCVPSPQPVAQVAVSALFGAD